MDTAIKVNKIPNLDVKKRLEDSRNLPKMPRLYLELIENKDKIKQGLVNKDYDPDDAMSDITFYEKKKSSGMNNNRSPQLSDVSEEEESLEGSESEKDSSDIEFKSDEEESQHASSDEGEEEVDSHSEKEKQREESEWSGDEQSSMGEEEDQEEELSEVGSERSAASSKSFTPKKHTSSSQGMSKSQKYAKILDENLPPKLSELEKKGEINTRRTIPTLDRIYNTEDEEEEMKRELLFKFELLKKSYRNINVPEFNIHSDLRQMSRSYESTLRRVSLDSCVENYKQLLIGAFMVLEFLLGYIFKFDMQGYTQQQILNMNQYERLLIELGEQSYVPGGAQWPVEWRLLLMVLGNAAIFIIAKMIMKKTGNNLMGMMNTFTTQAVSAASSGSGQEARRRMSSGTVRVDPPAGMYPADERRKHQLAITGLFAPTQQMDGKLLSSSFPDMRDPAVAIDIYRGDAGLDTGKPQSLFSIDTRLIDQKRLTKLKRVNLALGKDVRLDDGTVVRFDGATPFVNLQVSHDPGQFWVLVSAMSMMAGLLVSLVVRRRRVWARITPGQPGTVKVELGGLARTDNSGWGSEFEKLTEVLEKS